MRLLRLVVPAALAVVIALVVAGPSAAGGENLVANPGAEEGTEPPAAPDQVTGPRRWTRTGGLTVGDYGAPGLPDGAHASEISGGARLFVGGACDEGGFECTSAMSQEFDVAATAPTIDAGEVTASLSAAIGGRDTEADSGRVTLQFLSADSTKLGETAIGPITATDRGNQTRLLPRSTSITVPAGTRRLRVAALASGGEDGSIDAYFDNISLSLSGASEQPVPIDPRPDPGAGGGDPTAPRTPDDPDARPPAPPATLSTRPVRMSSGGLLRLRIVCASHVQRCSGRLYADAGRRRCGSTRVSVPSGRRRLVRLRLGRTCRRLVNRRPAGRVVTLRLRLSGQPELLSRLRVKPF